MTDYPNPPQTDWGKLPLLSEANDPETYRDTWGLVLDEQGWKRLQKQIIVPFDTREDFPDQGPFDGARAEAADTNVIYRWSSEAGDWKPMNTGTASNPVPETSYYESLSTADLAGGWDYFVTDTESLNDALSSLSDGETIMVAGNVRSDGWKDIDGVSKVTIRGIGEDHSKIKTQDGVEAGLFRLGGSTTVEDITFEDITLDGNAENIPDETVKWGNAITALDVQGLDVKDVTIKDTPNNSNNNDADNSVGIGLYYPSSDITIDGVEIDNPTAYRAIEITADDVTIRDTKTENVIERHVSLSSMRRDNRVAGDVTIESVEMVKGSGNDIGSHIALHGLNYDGSGAYPDPAEGTPLGEVRINDVDTEGNKRTGIALRQLSANAGPVTIRNPDVESSTDHGIIVAQGNQSSLPNAVIDIDLEMINPIVKNTGSNSIRIQGVVAPEIQNPTVRNGRVAISLENCPNHTVSNVDIDDCLVGYASVGTEESGVLNGGVIQNTDNQLVKMEAPKGRIDGVKLSNPSQSGSGNYSAVLTNAADQSINAVSIYGEGDANHGIQLGSDDCHVTCCVVEGVTGDDIRDFGGTSSFGANDATVVN